MDGTRHRQLAIVSKECPLVKTFITSAACLALCLSLFVAAQAPAQRGAAGPAPSVGIVDVAYIYKNYKRFQQQMDGMKADMENVKAVVTKERDRITRLMEKLKDFKPGTPDYAKLEEEITHAQAQFQANAALQQKDIMERESKVYLQVYKEVADAVQYHAQRRGMTLVLRFNGDPVDGANRDQILREINKPIVYNVREADITPDVLDDLNRTASVPKNAIRTGVPPRN
jgi:outer membrane protein